MIGRTVGGRYVIRGVLGTGGMGTVFSATQEPLGREVAVKVLHGEMARDPVALQRFTTEAQTVSRLNHPNIVTLFDFGPTDDGSLYLAMEKLEGTTVVDEVQRRGAFEPGEAYRLIRDVARALAAAHKAGIVHRDLKPENVMLTEAAGGERMVKVLDFGLAKIVGTDRRTDTSRPLTESDIIMGTPGYMSPEQIHGFAVDGRADLYALGVIWWELLTGRQLFFGKSPIEVLMRHLEEKPPSPSQVKPGLVLPPAGLTLLGRLLEKDREKRPADGEAAAAALAQLEGEPWSAPRSAPPPPTPAPVAPTGAGDWEAAFGALGGDPGSSPVRAQPRPGSAPLTPLSELSPAPGARPPPTPPYTDPPRPADPLAPFQAAVLDPGSNPFPAAPTPSRPGERAGDPGSGPQSSAPYDPMGAIGLDEGSGPQGDIVPGGKPFSPDDPRYSVRPAAVPKPQLKERLWTVQRGERKESGVPESTVRRLAREGKLQPTDLLSAPGETPRPAHSFPSLGLKPPPRADEAEPKKPRAQGARARSRKPWVVAALFLVVVAGGGALFVLDPPRAEALVDAGRDLVDQALTAVGGVFGGLEMPTARPSPIAAVKDAWARELGVPPEGEDSDVVVARHLGLAQRALALETRAGQLEADAALRRALLVDERSLLALGRFLENRARLDDAAPRLAEVDARRLLEAGFAEDDQSVPLRRARAAMALAAGARTQTEVDVGRLLEDGERTFEVFLYRGEALLDSDAAKAAEAADQAASLAPTSTWVRRLRGALLRRQGQYRAALEHLDARLERESSDALAVRERALVDADVGQGRRAVNRLKAHLSKDPGDDGARRLAAHLLAELGATDEARDLVKAAPKQGARSAGAHARLEAYAVALSAEPALDAGAKLATAYPDEAAVRYAYGLQLLKARRSSDAEQELKAAIERDPDGAESYVMRSALGEAELDAGRFEAALSSFRWAKNLRPGWLPAHVGEAIALIRLGRLGDAESALQELEKTDLLAWHERRRPRSVPLDNNLERMDARLKQLDDADSPAVVATARALVHMALSDDRGAEVHIARVLKRDRNHPLALTLFGAVELLRGKPKRALGRVGPLEVAGTLTPAARLVQARAAIADDATRKARMALRPLEGDPMVGPVVTRLLGEAELQDGNAAAAARKVAEAFAARPDDVIAAELLARLERSDTQGLR